MRIILTGLIYLYASFGAVAQFSNLLAPADPFAPDPLKVVRVASVAKLSEALSKLASDTHIILDSGTYTLPNPLFIKNATRSPLKLRISPPAGGEVQLLGASHVHVHEDLSLEFDRLHFSADETINIDGGTEVLINACRVEKLALMWLAPDSAALKIVNSAFIHGAKLLVLSDEESRVTLMHTTWSGGKTTAVDLVGKGRVQLRLDNNLFSGSGSSALHAKDAFHVMLEGRNNLFHEWETIGLDGEARLMKNRMADPLLKEEGWHLTEKSPAINAGAALGESVSSDLEGDYRGLRPDIGADEF